MLSEKQEEIMEAIWCAAEDKQYSFEHIKNKCVVDFSKEDIDSLEKKGLLVTEDDQILFSSEGKRPQLCL